MSDTKDIMLETNSKIEEAGSEAEVSQDGISAVTIVENLNASLVELKETKDYLSYATLIDVYLTDISRFDQEEKLMILNALEKILEENHDIIYEIGWDLPDLLIKFLFGNLQRTIRLQGNESIVIIIQIFKLLSEYGNSKELLLKSCELISKLTLQPDEKGFINEDQEYFFKIAFHALIELLNSSLKKITTNYPSRFLSSAIVSFTNFLIVNQPFVSSATNLFVFRRFYTFIRDYSPPKSPSSNTSELSQEQLIKIKEDEEYLQRVLLTSFLTNGIPILISKFAMNWTYNFYSQKLHKPNSKFRIPEAYLNFSHFDISADDNYEGLMLRCAQLAWSLDLNLEELFFEDIRESAALFNDNVVIDEKKELDPLSEEIYSLVISDFNKSQKAKKASITLSKEGIMLLLTAQVTLDKSYESRILNIRPHDMIKFFLRKSIPAIIDSSLNFKSTSDALFFWSWYSIHYEKHFDRTLTSSSIAQVDKIYTNLYLQLLISRLTASDNPAVRMIIYTLVTKILALSKEDISYDFIKDSLEVCPYDNAKAALIGILKDLLIRQKIFDSPPSSANKSLENAINSLQINGKEDKEMPSKPPSLPSRELPTYIKLTPERSSDILNLTDKSIDLTFTKDEKIDQDQVPILLSYLNLLIVIKSKIKNQDQIDKIITKVEENYSKYEKSADHKDKPNYQLEFIPVALETLKKK
ncbi:hypothetical protein PACTADRAFT_52078 [Pachysolen tannophilus NRRL Y-2460]|uniref:Uncharacterized protein n=1 Tax=Pachysolen tannophilus NRRL Y-2460 TaxID=669874 RepID=A0A1E4TP18_PACTA|nr:hypothetical protein PACTADRAFT_52078 [Pachysolen tannophilus NRRL Y-2460]